MFQRDGTFFRQVNRSYGETLAALMKSGLYAKLVEQGLLIPHETADLDLAPEPNAAAVIRPEQLGFVSYPFEWSFSQLRASALTTLQVQRHALDHGLSLKDASAYNIQLHNGRPTLIDTLSFEPYEAGLAVGGLSAVLPALSGPAGADGLPRRPVGNACCRVTWTGCRWIWPPGCCPGERDCDRACSCTCTCTAGRKRSPCRFRARTRASLTGRMSQRRLEALLESLESTVRRLSWNPGSTPWASYGDQSSYSDAGRSRTSKRLVAEYHSAGRRPIRCGILAATLASSAELRRRPETMFRWCRSTATRGPIDLSYRQMVEGGERNLYPIVADLTSPSPALGWDNREVRSLTQRGPAGLVMALALIHHLAISNNTRFERLARFFASLGSELLIEFVPPDDPMVRRLLTMRNHTFPWYAQQRI